MGTHGVIAIGHPGKWKGAGNRWDSMPEKLGVRIFNWMKVHTMSDLRNAIENVGDGFDYFPIPGYPGDYPYTSEDDDTREFEYLYIVDPDGERMTIQSGKGNYVVDLIAPRFRLVET